MPEPHFVAPWAEWPTIHGGVRNQRQISSTLKPRVCSICASSGVMLTCWYFMPASRTIVLPALTAPTNCFVMSSRTSLRCSGLRIWSVESTPPSFMPLANILAADSSAAMAEPNTWRPIASGLSPHKGSVPKPRVCIIWSSR
ncbi:hypothetical protein D9M70_306340 [compost metagenome]